MVCIIILPVNIDVNYALDKMKYDLHKNSFYLIKSNQNSSNGIKNSDL